MMVGIETVPCTDCGNALSDEEATQFIRNNFAGHGTPLCEPCGNQRAIFHLRNKTLRDLSRTAEGGQPEPQTDENGMTPEEQRQFAAAQQAHEEASNEAQGLDLNEYLQSSDTPFKDIPHNEDTRFTTGEPMEIAWQLLKAALGEGEV